jgi:hypothetical protein
MFFQPGFIRGDYRPDVPPVRLRAIMCSRSIEKCLCRVLFFPDVKITQQVMRRLKSRQKTFPVVNQDIDCQTNRFSPCERSIVEIYHRSKGTPAAVPIVPVCADKNVLDRFYNRLRLHLIHFRGPTIQQWYEVRSKIQKRPRGGEFRAILGKIYARKNGCFHGWAIHEDVVHSASV